MPTCQILTRVEDVETCGAGGKREMIRRVHHLGVE